DERRLHWMRLFRRPDAFDGSDGAIGRFGYGESARRLRLAIDQHHARTALGETAAEFDAGQAQVVAQDIEQRFVRVAYVDGRCLAVDAQSDAGHKSLRSRASGKIIAS